VDSPSAVRGAGIGEIHLHQLCHSFAHMVAERSGSLSDTQEALGHKHAATTRVYVQRIALKRDKFGREITRRLKTWTRLLIAYKLKSSP